MSPAVYFVPALDPAITYSCTLLATWIIWRRWRLNLPLRPSDLCLAGFLFAALVVWYGFIAP